MYSTISSNKCLLTLNRNEIRVVGYFDNSTLWSVWFDNKKIRVNRSSFNGKVKTNVSLCKLSRNRDSQIWRQCWPSSDRDRSIDAAIGSVFRDNENRKRDFILYTLNTIYTYNAVRDISVPVKMNSRYGLHGQFNFSTDTYETCYRTYTEKMAPVKVPNVSKTIKFRRCLLYGIRRK